MGQGITLGAEPSSNGQKALEEFDKDGVGHRRALSPQCLMMMMMMMMIHTHTYILNYKHTYINTTYLHAYIHTHMQTYSHTYTHTTAQHTIGFTLVLLCF